MNIQTQTWQTAWDNRGLIYGALKRAGIQTSDRDYEDLVQEGLIFYAQCLASKQDPDLGLIFQKLCWRSLDYLRKRSGAQCPPPEYHQPLSLHDYLALEAALPQLTRQELWLLRRHLLNGESLVRLSREANCSCRTLRRVKGELCRHLRSILTRLANSE